jgi:flagellar biosynthesis/type III secretory pathway protein FliH
MNIRGKITLVICIVVGIIILLNMSNNNAYDDGYKKGYAAGNNIGYERARSEDKITIEGLQTKVNSITKDYETKMTLLRKESENKIIQARKEEFINGQTQMLNRIESQINTTVTNNIANNDWNAPVTSIKNKR